MQTRNYQVQTRSDGGREGEKKRAYKEENLDPQKS